jgi:dihydrofolate synthase / folylpolyglutamate synthase
MNYSQAIEYLYDLRLFGLKLGLENTLRLAAAAGNPQDRLRFIHVAGTNGKGSTCAMLEGIYRAAGLRVGLFTSPHLISFAERIQVNRKLISQSDVARLVGQARSLISEADLRPATPTPAFPTGQAGCPTFFEVVTVMALTYFAQEQCDLVIWETGMGGRLDATNIVTPLASVITNVQLDHQKWLGQTVPEIAREKAGIIKPRVPVITAATDPAALEVISQIARACQAPLTVVTDAPAAVRTYEIALAGGHQQINAAVALAVVNELREHLPAPPSAIRAGLKNVQWAGRLQVVHRGGQVILLDGAHNPGGAQTLAAALQTSFAGRPPALILATMEDKDYAAICGILAPLASRILLAPIGTERTADPRLLLECCRHANPTAPSAAFDNLAGALEKAAAEPFVVVTGSLHFVGEAMELLGLAPPSAERALNEYTVAANAKEC